MSFIRGRVRSGRKDGRRALLAGCAAITLGLAVVGCGSSSAPPSSASSGPSNSASATSVTIGFAPPNQSSPALVGLAKSLTAYAATKGAKTRVVDPSNDSTTQVQQLISMIDLGEVKAVWAMAVSPETMAPVIAAAEAHHVGLLDTGTPQEYGAKAPGHGLSYSVINYTKFGSEIGSALGTCINQRLHGKGEVLYVTNPAGATGKPAEDAAFMAALKQTSPAASIVATTTSANDRLTAQENSLSAIQGHPGIDAVAGVTDEGSLGALTALKLAGKDPTSSACAVGAGGSPEAISDVNKHLEYAYVVINFQGDLEQNVNELLKMSSDPTATGIQLYTPFTTYSKFR
jgi:ABC-type sugar transport system substrate-binding protein